MSAAVRFLVKSALLLGPWRRLPHHPHSQRLTRGETGFLDQTLPLGTRPLVSAAPGFWKCCGYALEGVVRLGQGVGYPYFNG